MRRFGFLSMLIVLAAFVAAQDGCQTTEWLDRDDPTGEGDYETIVDFLEEGTLPESCAEPISISCRTVGTHIDWTETGEVYHCDRTIGGYCVNDEQPDGTCMDYEVQFVCPPAGQ